MRNMVCPSPYLHGDTKCGLEERGGVVYHYGQTHSLANGSLSSGFSLMAVIMLIFVHFVVNPSRKITLCGLSQNCTRFSAARSYILQSLEG